MCSSVMIAGARSRGAVGSSRIQPPTAAGPEPKGCDRPLKCRRAVDYVTGLVLWYADEFKCVNDE